MENDWPKAIHQVISMLNSSVYVNHKVEIMVDQGTQI